MIASVIKALEILEVFSPEKPVLSLAEISTLLGYPKTTLHTLLRTLVYKGVIEHGDKGTYSLGTAIISMTQAIRVNVQLRDRVAPLLRELADTCRESVYLTILDKSACLYIYAIESSDRLLARTAIGERTPLHCTSAGKAILSFLPADTVEDLVKEQGMTKYNDKTIIDFAVLLKDLKISRSRGFAVDKEEHETGMFCLGSPIFNESGEVFAACSVSGTDPDILGKKKALFSAGIRYTALEISRRMGFVPSGDKKIWNEIANPLRKG